MRFLTETIIRGELQVLELSEQDFCPECCGTLQAGGTPQLPHLKCTSCYLILRPKADVSTPSTPEYPNTSAAGAKHRERSDP